MAKLSDADVKRFVTALEQGESETPQEADFARSSGASQSVEDAAGATHVLTGSAELIGRAIEQALYSYLGVELHCDASSDASLPVQPLWFETPAPERWVLGFDASLAAALSDLMLGGDGKAARPMQRSRAGALLAPLVSKLIAAAAGATSSATPATAKAMQDRVTGPQPLAGGTISGGSVAGAWSIGFVAEARAGAVTTRADSITTEPATPVEIVHVHAARDEIQQTPSMPRERILAVRPAGDANAALVRAVQAGGARLGEITHCEATVEPAKVTLVESPSLARDDLKLALIAGGQGSLVLSADREAMAVIAQAVTGAPVDAQEPGAVVVDAVETALRAAMRGFADLLPGLARGPQRFVRLTESAMPARSPHYAVVAPVRLDRATATLGWLVPTAMAELGEGRTPD